MWLSKIWALASDGCTETKSQDMQMNSLVSTFLMLMSEMSWQNFILGKTKNLDCFNVWNQCCLIWTVDLTSVADEFKFRRMFYDNVRFQGIFTLFCMIAEETAEFDINFIKGDKLWYLKWLCSESMALEFSRKVWIAALVLDHCIFVCVSWQTAFTYDVSKIEMNGSVVPH